MPEPKSPVVVGLEAYEKMYAESQAEYETLPALRSSPEQIAKDKRCYVLSRWELSAEDRDAIANGADVYVSILTSTGSINPYMVEVFSNHPDNTEPIKKRLGLADTPPVPITKRSTQPAVWRGEEGFTESKSEKPPEA